MLGAGASASPDVMGGEGGASSPAGKEKRRGSHDLLFVFYESAENEDVDSGST